MPASKKKKQEKKPLTKPEQPVSANTAEEEKSTPFDFGGLPSRDLKKNLGCG